METGQIDRQQGNLLPLLHPSGAGVWKEYKEIKERYNIPDGMIEIELTETVFIDDSQLLFVKSVLDGFRACGFRVALDDFGFAYSSLGVLNELEVDTLKLDQMCIRDSFCPPRLIFQTFLFRLPALNAILGRIFFSYLPPCI